MTQQISEQVLRRVIRIVSEQLGVRESEVSHATDPVQDLGADSLDSVELIMAVEEEFEREVPDDVAERIRTVQDMVDYIVDGQLKKTAKSRDAHLFAQECESESKHAKLIPLSQIVKTDYMEAGVPTFVRLFNENMASGAKLSAATVRDLEGSDAFEIAMGGRLDKVDIHDIAQLLRDSDFAFQHVVEHIECFEGENGDTYQIVSYVSYTLPMHTAV